LPDAKVLYRDDFDRLSSSQWYFESGYVKASDGLLEITGTPNWATRISRERSLNEGEGVLILFKYDVGAEIVFNMGSGEWGTSSFREWDIGGTDFYASLTQGTSDEAPDGSLIGNLTSNPYTWYYLLLAIGKEGEFVAQVWERDDPSQKGEYRRTFNEDWVGLAWDFWIDANKGKAYVDAFTEISFSEILGGEASAMPCQQVPSGETAEIESPWLRNEVTFDGKMTAAEEWSDAVCLDLTLLEQHEGPATISSRWWVKNDAQWLYLLARVPVAELEAYGAFIDYFWPYPFVDQGSTVMEAGLTKTTMSRIFTGGMEKVGMRTS